MTSTVDTNDVLLISSKLSILEQPLNTLLNIEDVLIPKINYTSVKLANNVNTSTTSSTSTTNTNTDKYIISRNISDEYNDSITSNLDNDTYNYIVDDFQKIDVPEKETLEEIYTHVILEKQNKSDSADDDDIDILIQNITTEISTINDQIRDNITTTQILLANTQDAKNYSDADIKFIGRLTDLLNEYKNSILWNTINININ
jgi:hypothetical protein